MWRRASLKCLLCIPTALALLQVAHGAEKLHDKNRGPPTTRAVVHGLEAYSPKSSMDVHRRTLDPNSNNKPGYTQQEDAEWIVGLDPQIYQQQVKGGHDVQPQQDPCTIVSKFTGPISYDVVKACLDADFDFPKDLRHDTVATIKNLISNFYVFEDLAANPPDVRGLTFRPVELIKEMEQLLRQNRALSLASDDNDSNEQGDENEKIDGLQDNMSQIPMTHREFHDGISRILSKARDGHLSYDADCFRAFRFQHGFFMNHVVRDGKAVVKVHSVMPYFQSLNGLEHDILNCDVVAIAGKDAVEYLQEWADDHVSMSKDANVRFNAALATPQYRSGTIDFFIPGKFSERFMLPEEQSLEFTFRCPGLSSEDTLKVDVRWVGFYSHDRTRPFKDVQSYYEANCIKSDEEVDGSEDGRSRLEREQDSEQRNITDLKSALRVLLSGSTITTNHSSTTFEPRTDSVPTTRTDVPSDTSKDVSKNVEEILSKLDMISPEQLPVVKFYDDYGGRTGDMNTASGTPLFAELYRGHHGINALLLNDGKTGVITVRTESSTIRGQPYSQIHPAWAGSLIQAINVLRPRAERLILDLSHNTGGYVCLGLTMVQLFFPERPRLVTSVRLSELGTKLMKAGAMGMDHFTRSYGDPLVVAYQKDFFQHSISHPHRNLTFTDYLSDRCSIADRYAVHAGSAEQTYPLESKDQEASGKAVYHPWNPKNMAILTDGYCGSSCALITNMLHSKFAVKTVVIGGRSTSTQGPMSYSTFPGLQVIDDMFILNEVQDARRQIVSEQEQEIWEREPVMADGGHDPFTVENLDATGKDDSDVDEEDDEDEDEDEEGEDDLESIYPKSFAHKSRLRLTWRQIYHTGDGIGMFQYSPVSDEYEPLWKEVEQWHEYSLIPASHRLDYTDHNVHSMGAIWMDTRDAVWGAQS